ncbi:hypothetical protein NL676_002574 [Syzygium grande]|nr:hypothetical protein NL676_002574 [Syzygium grande]
MGRSLSSADTPFSRLKGPWTEAAPPPPPRTAVSSNSQLPGGHELGGGRLGSLSPALPPPVPDVEENNPKHNRSTAGSVEKLSHQQHPRSDPSSPYINRGGEKRRSEKQCRQDETRRDETRGRSERGRTSFMSEASSRNPPLPSDLRRNRGYQKEGEEAEAAVAADERLRSSEICWRCARLHCSKKGANLVHEQSELEKSPSLRSTPESWPPERRRRSRSRRCRR